MAETVRGPLTVRVADVLFLVAEDVVPATMGELDDREAEVDFLPVGAALDVTVRGEDPVMDPAALESRLVTAVIVRGPDGLSVAVPDCVELF